MAFVLLVTFWIKLSADGFNLSKLLSIKIGYNELSITEFKTATIVALGIIIYFCWDISRANALRITYKPVYPFDTEHATGRLKYFSRLDSKRVLYLAFDDNADYFKAYKTALLAETGTAGSLT
jgi:hypothetical protein